jgi:hypothetical protein
VLIHAGTNDMNNGVNPANAPTRLGKLIDQIFTDAPGVTIVVAKIIPAQNATTESRIVAYNAALPGVVQSRASAGKHILLVDMWSALSVNDLADGLHPNDGGYQKMSKVWQQGIDQAIANGWVTNPTVPGGSGCLTGHWVYKGVIAAGVGAAPIRSASPTSSVMAWPTTFMFTTTVP